jgi:peptidylprolyl isomerase
MTMNKLKYISIFAVVTAIALIACFGEKKATAAPNDGVKRKWTSTPVAQKKQQTVVMPSGLEYTITHKGNGPLPKAGDRSLILYKGYLTGDTSKVFDASSRHGNIPYSFHPGRGGEVIAGWDSIGKYLHAGDRAIVKIPAKMAYGAQQRNGIPANSDLTFEMEVVDVIAKPVKWDGAGKDTITTPSGLKLVMFEKHPDSALVKQGQTVTVDYSGYLLNGYMFDSSVDRGQPYSYQVGRSPMIAGWAEAINLLREGEKAQIIVPFQLAYGAQGRPPQIPGKSDLIFDMHLIDIK